MIPRFSKNLTRKATSGAHVDFSGRWINELGSEMTLTIDKGVVQGKYRTGVGEAPEEEAFDLCGFATDDLIVFCVNFGSYGSLTAWAGQHAVEDGQEQIMTLWHMARNAVDGHDIKHLWSTMLTGADTFKRVGRSGC